MRENKYKLSKIKQLKREIDILWLRAVESTRLFDARRASDLREIKINELIELELQIQKEIVYDLNTNGCDIDKLTDLYIKNNNFDKKIYEILIKHLTMNYTPNIKAIIATIFLMRNSREFWPVLIDEFLKGPHFGSVYDDIIANILLNTAKSQDIDQIIDIIKITSNPSRVILLRVLRKYRNKNIAAANAIENFGSDENLRDEISSWK
ncbi:MAG: hypothetical protein KGL46_13720 [Hyphomicrobiales bacterium]|nr:hypothetical protein [Hyphomicrobiales bacterium]